MTKEKRKGQGALEGAEEVNSAAAEQVRAALTGRFHGVRIPLSPLFQPLERR